MGRPRKLDLARRKVYREDGTVGYNATRDIYKKVYDVCKLYGKGEMSLKQAAKACGISDTLFYRYVHQYDDCRKVANHVGLGVSITPPNGTKRLRAQKPPKEDAYTSFDLPTRKKWTMELKQEAIKRISEALRRGLPFKNAIYFANVNDEIVDKWTEEEPGLKDLFKKAESEWSAYFFGCVANSLKVASEKGRFSDLLEGAERKFHEDWNKIKPIDVKQKAKQEEDKPYSVKTGKSPRKCVQLDFEIEEKL